MTDVGSARVEVTGDVRGFARQTERDLNRALDKVELDPIEVPVDKEGARKAGEEAGAEFGDGAYRGADGKLRDAFTGRFISEGEKAGQEGGERAGKAFGDGTDKSLKKEKNKIAKATRTAFVDSVKELTKPLADALGSAVSVLPALANPAIVAAGVGIAAGLAAAIGPVFGGFLAAALIAGGGLGVIGLGAMLLKGEPELKNAAKSLMDTVKKEFTKAAQPLLKPLVDSLKGLSKIAGEVAPVLHSMFANLAPAVQPFILGLGQLVQHLLPGLNQLTAAAAPLLIAIGNTLPTLGDGFSKFFGAIAGSGPAATTFMTDFLKGTASAVAGLGTGLAWLANQYPKVRDTLIAGFTAIGDGISTFWKSFSGDGPAALQIFRDFATGAGAAIGVVGKALGWLVGQYPAVRTAAINAFNGIKTAIENTVNYVRSNQDWLGPLASAVAGAAVAFGALKTAMAIYTTYTKIATAVQLAWDAAMAANPIGIIVIAIGALVGALIWFFTQTKLGREIWATTWAAIQAAAQAVAAWFTGTVVPAFTAAWNAIKAAAQAVASWWTGTLVPALQTAWTAIQTAASAVAGWFMTYVAPVFTALGGLIAAIFARIQQAASFMWGVVQPIFSMLGTAFQIAWNVISTVWNAVGPVIFAAITGYLHVLQAVWTTVWNVVKQVVITVFNVVKTVVQTALQVIAGIIRAVTAAINGNWSGAWNEMKGVVSNILNGIRSVISSVLNGIKGVISATMSGVKSIWSAAWNGLKGVVSAAWSSIRGAVNSIKSGIIGIFSGAGSWLLSAGRKIIDGLISGIQAGFGRVKSLLGSLTSMLPDWKGPAELDKKILEKSGDLVMRGFESGLEGRFDSIRKTLGGFTAGLPATSAQARGGDGASAANPGGGRHTTVTFGPGSIVIQGGGAAAGQEAAEAFLEALANAQD